MGNNAHYAFNQQNRHLKKPITISQTVLPKPKSVNSMKKFIFSILAFTLLLTSFTAYSDEAKNTRADLETTHANIENKDHPTKEKQAKSEHIENNSATRLEIYLIKKSEEIDSLKQVINKQSDRINKLEEDLVDSSGSGMNFAVWTGILLTAVAILVTILGVIMAIFSFIGYKKIMSSAIDAASEKASIIAAQIATDKAPDTTKEVLIKLIDNGDLNKIIFHAVEQVVYRGIGLPEQEELNGEDQ